MMTNKGQFQKGQSGNPKGRPKKERTLSRMLENGGRNKIGPDGETAQRLMVQRIWQGISTGQIDFDGRVLELSGSEYTALAKMVFAQIDGPPPAALDVTSNGQTVPVVFQIVEGVPSDTAKKAASDSADEDDAL